MIIKGEITLLSCAFQTFVSVLCKGWWLIPVDVARVTASLLVFQGICQLCCTGAEGEVERGVGQENDATRHLKAVQIARERGGGHREPLIVEVVARREVDVPPLSQRDIAREVERLCEGVGVAHVARVDGLGAVFRHGDTITKSEAPGQREC